MGERSSMLASSSRTPTGGQTRSGEPAMNTAKSSTETPLLPQASPQPLTLPTANLSLPNPSLPNLSLPNPLSPILSNPHTPLPNPHTPLPSPHTPPPNLLPLLHPL